MKPETCFLSAGSTHALRLRRGPLVVRCLRGRAWVTLEAELRDYVVNANETLVVQGPGRLVIQALSDAELTLAPAPRVLIAA